MIPSTPLLSSLPQRLIDRELSWLAFNHRVLEESLNPRHPLLERVLFLAISANNLDESLIVKAPHLDFTTRSAEANAAITEALDLHRAIWDELKQALAEADVLLVDPLNVEATDQEWLTHFFHGNIFPALTPVALDGTRPFPFIPSGAVSMALRLGNTDGSERVTILQLPTALGRFIRLPSDHANNPRTLRFMMLDDIVRQHLHHIFPNQTLRESGTFRVLRDSALHLDATEDSEDFVEMFESALKQRPYGAIVRLAMTRDVSQETQAFLIEQMDVPRKKTVVRDSFLRLSDIRQMAVKDRPDLRFPPYEPRFPPRIHQHKGDYFSAISQKDLLLHHPYESFGAVVQFIRQAAQDPDTVAIKQTLYRTSATSPIMQALADAAKAGKSVTVVIELKARFDEESNLRWARDLEQAGAQVVFGFPDMKTHTKMALVIRRENDALRSYAHIGTGNYHPDTARIYTDLSLFTADPVLCQDIAAVFNYMTGHAEPSALHKLIIAPTTLRPTLIQLIDDEIAHAKAGRPATIWAKLNALVDPAIIDKLYEASQAGVSIDLIVRSACCLRAGVPGLSENIRVKSIVGRFLEHSRIVAFGNGDVLPHDAAKVFISSADWMARNLDHRIETLMPIEDPDVHKQIIHHILPACLLDTRQSWTLQPDDTYCRMDTTERDFSAHDYFMTMPSLSGCSEDPVSVPPLPYPPVRTAHAKKTREEN